MLRGARSQGGTRNPPISGGWGDGGYLAQRWDKYIYQFEKNAFCNEKQIHFAIENKHILQSETNTFYNLKQIHFAI